MSSTGALSGPGWRFDKNDGLLRLFDCFGSRAECPARAASRRRALSACRRRRPPSRRRGRPAAPSAGRSAPRAPRGPRRRRDETSSRARPSSAFSAGAAASSRTWRSVRALLVCGHQGQWLSKLRGLSAAGGIRASDCWVVFCRSRRFCRMGRCGGEPRQRPWTRERRRSGTGLAGVVTIQTIVEDA